MKWLLCLLFSPSLYAAPPAIEKLFVELSNKNIEVEGSRLQSQFSYQSLRGSKSRLWPTFGLNFTANEGSDSGISGGAPISDGTQSPDGSLGSQSSSSVSNLDSINKGWMVQPQVSYFLFTQFAVTEDIRRAENTYQGSKINEGEVFDGKKSQLLQLLLEWQNLYKVKTPINEAAEMIAEVQSFANKKSRMLYSPRDRANLKEKSTSIQYHRVRVLEGMSLTESAIRNLLPEMTTERLSQLPLIRVNYDLPQVDEFDDRYRNQSRAYKKASLDVDSARGYLRSAEWQKPWIPSIYWSANYSYSGDYDNQTKDNGISTSIVFSFNIFDGFYTQARTQQAQISLEASQLKQRVEADRRVLKMKHSRMKAVVAQAEYEMKKAVARKKELRYLDVKRKIRQGVGSRLDLSASTLDYVKAQMEALTSLKDYQQSILDIAVELNEFDRVKIDAENS